MVQSKNPGWLIISIIFTWILILGMLGCTPPIPTQPSDTLQRGVLSPYQTPIPTATERPSIPDLANTPVATRSLSPTPTPVIYSVAAGDTLTSIAYRYGIKLNDLVSANPGIDPNFLTIGITLTIPTRSENSPDLALPTPIALVFSQPRCYATAEQGLWCLLLVENNQPFSVENISGAVTLSSPAWNKVITETANPPLNILRPGERTVLLAYFQPEILQNPEAQAEIITLLPVPGNDSRYVNIEVGTHEISISPSGLSATVTGQIEMKGDSLAGVKIRLAAIAYDADGNPVGIRRWESKPTISENQLPFSITVFSLGPPIEEIEISAEAQ